MNDKARESAREETSDAHGDGGLFTHSRLHRYAIDTKTGFRPPQPPTILYLQEFKINAFINLMLLTNSPCKLLVRMSRGDR
ncbi:MAG: hypothetical protein DI547_16860 [Sphingobium sp.]|nr:MAG: hypothetical protein DI547_16860 [Sphingobium sp.]